jgi:hypothetical protein
MRTAPLSSFRKLWGRIEEDISATTTYTVYFNNSNLSRVRSGKLIAYDVRRFGGEKYLVLSTASYFGGKNEFLGILYLFTGCVSMVLALVFLSRKLCYADKFKQIEYKIQ